MSFMKHTVVRILPGGLFLMMAAGKQSSSHFLFPDRRHICKHVKGLAKFGRQLAAVPKRVRRRGRGVLVILNQVAA